MSAAAPPSEAPIRDAATVILVRRDAKGIAVLMGMRGTAAIFLPSKFVFPGGALDPDDAAEAPPDLSIDPRLYLALREDGGPPAALIACARRELAEETGLRLKPGAALQFIFRAITPLGRPRRFDARFFIADAGDVAGDPDDFSAADGELGHLAWVPLDAARTLDLPFITEMVLAEVAALPLTDMAPDPCRPVPFFDNSRGRSRFLHLAC